MMNTLKIGLAGVTTAALLVLTACGTSGGSDEDSASAPSTSTSAQSSSSTTSTAGTGSGSESSTTAATASITIKDFKFQTPETVAPGAKITVTNEDSATHTVTVDQGDAFDVNIPSGESATLTAPSKPDESGFHCTFHSNMQGTLVVEK